MSKTLRSVRQVSQASSAEQKFPHRKYEITGILLLSVSLLSLASLYFSSADGTSVLATGWVGQWLEKGLTCLAGGGRYFLAILTGLWGITLIAERRFPTASHRMYGIMSLFWIALAVLHMQLPVGTNYWEAGLAGRGGGLLGGILAWTFTSIFGSVGAYIILLSMVMVSILSITNQPLLEIASRIWQGIKNALICCKGSLEKFIFEEEVTEEISLAPSQAAGGISQPEEQPISEQEEEREKRPYRLPKNERPLLFAAQEENSALFSNCPLSSNRDGTSRHLRQETSVYGTEAAKGDLNLPPNYWEEGGFALPPLNLLQPTAKTKSSRLTKDIAENSRILEETMENFGVKARVIHVSRGPAVTRYEVQPAPGTKVSKIVNLADDIALNMAAQQVRIEAPVPGKSVVGIEVPNKEVAIVHLREVLESKEFQDSSSKLLAALGKDITGNPVVIDLSKMPHLLIAGATGMGKSVCLNALIASILFRSKPTEVKFLIIDPKMVELAAFNGIPHLIAPVVTHPKKAAVALRWAVTEMESRYEKFASWGAKDIIRYNQIQLKEGQPEECLPYIVVIIDELADLMMIAPTDVEDAICRLAQMARAAGIHLVVATQRPSVDVITGLIKANIPSRIAFAVSSQTDSRTILDVNGAEKLVGRGDMLYMPVGASKPLRVQGAFISDREVEQLVSFLRRQGKPRYNENIANLEIQGEEEPTEEEDKLLPDAIRLFIESGQASISLLQRKFHIGYTRAARLIDQMEQRGFIGPYEGSKPREVLITIEQFEKQFGKF